MEPPTPGQECVCSNCKTIRRTKPTAKGLARLPMGWKRLEAAAYCPDCWKNRFVVRAVTFPVAGPIDGNWDKLRGALNTSWTQSTGLANWAVTELAKGDAVRMPEMKRLPPMPRAYLYPAARKAFPGMASDAVVALLHSVEQRYRKARLAVIWRAEASLSRYRYPVPYPVRKQGWKAQIDGNALLIDVTLNETPFTLRLRGGPEFRRQIAAFKKIASGAAVRSELTLYRQRANESDHRMALVDRNPGGGQRVHYRIMAKITAWIPREIRSRERSGSMDVRTGATSFLSACIAGREPWVLNADHVRRWIARRRRQNDRLAQDNKVEIRQDKRKRLQLADFREKSGSRFRQRMSSFCHQAAAMLANYADRNGMAEVQYDCTNKSYFSEFPWAEMQRLLAIKLDERGIKLQVIGAADDTESGDTDIAA